MRSVLVALLAFIISPSALAELRGWVFMQSVGGISISKPVKSSASWSLPLKANLSGLENITSKPTAINSALVCESVQVRIAEKDIFLTVSSALPSSGITASCPPAHLGSLPQGIYRVLYQGPTEEPHFLGEVEIGF